MKFRLTYEGQLLTSSSNTSGRVEAKWAIRKQIYPQLVDLWQTHPVLKGIGLSAESTVTIAKGVTSLSTPVSIKISSPSQVTLIRLREPMAVGGRDFIPLVRKSLELTCGLDILFLRRDQPGSLFLQGGDIDNRLKTLFDALKVPSEADLKVEQPDPAHDPFFCLLEDDSLITTFSVETDRLLARPKATPNEVYLVIDVTVAVTTITETNVGFLGN